MSNHQVWMAYRSMTSDRSVTKHKVPKGLVRRVFGYARPYRRFVVAFLLVLAVTAVLSVMQPLLFRRIVDDGISMQNASVVTWTAVLIAVLALAVAALGLLSRWFSARIGEGLIYDLRTQVYSHVQRQSVAFFTRAQTGALVSRLNSDVIGAQQAFTSTLGGVVGNVITLSIVLVTMFLLSWQITLISLILLPVFLLPARYMGRRLAVLTREQMTLNASMSGQMTERFNVAGALLVKLFGRPDEEDRVFSQRAAAVRGIGVSMAMANTWFFTALTLVAAMATAIAYGLGGNFVISGVLTLGTLLALIGLLAQLYGPLTALSNVRIDVMKALVSFERVFEILDLPPLVAESSSPVDVPSGALEVAFHHVDFSYPAPADVSLASLETVAREASHTDAVPVLHDVTFTAAAGTMTAVVGPSGAGKTTMTSLVNRLYDVNHGAITFNGIDVREFALQDLHDAVGVVTQDAHMFHDTIGANLRYAKPSASDDELWAACEAAYIGQMVRSLPDGLDTVVGDRGYRLSGGEKQRLAIARLFLKAPRIVVLDEATAHLDSESEAAVQQALAAVLVGRTSIVIAHRLSTVRAADQLLVVDAGRIVESGTHAELMRAQGLYADLYDTQFESGASEGAEQSAVDRDDRTADV